MSNTPISSPEYLDSRVKAVQEHIDGLQALLGDFRGLRARLGALEQSFEGKVNEATSQLQEVIEKTREVSQLAERAATDVSVLQGARADFDREIAAARTALDAMPGHVREIQAEVRAALERWIAEGRTELTTLMNTERRQAEERERTLASFVRAQVSDAQRAYEGLARRLDEQGDRIGAVQASAERAVADERAKLAAVEVIAQREHEHRLSAERRIHVWAAAVTLVAVAGLALAFVALLRL